MAHDSPRELSPREEVFDAGRWLCCFIGFVGERNKRIFRGLDTSSSDV